MYRQLSLILALILATPAWGAITFRDCNSGFTDNEDFSAITKPTGTVDGDVIIAAAGWNDNTADPINITGTFTGVEDFEDAGPGSYADSTAALWYRVASSEGTSYTITATGVGTENGAAIICSWDGVDVTPFQVTYVRASHYLSIDCGASTCSTTPPSPQPITTTGAAEVVIFQYTNIGGNGITDLACPSGYTEREQVYDAGFGKIMNVCTKSVTSGTETPGTVSNTGQTDSEDIWFITIALEPESSALLLRRRR